MKNIRCPYCSKNIEQLVKYCTHCGNEIDLTKIIPQATPVHQINLNNLRNLVINYINDLATNGCDHQDCDCKHYIFEEAMITFYDDSIFNWINKQTE